MKKYIGAVVRKCFQLAIAAEQDHFENQTPMPKKHTSQEHLKKQNYIVFYRVAVAEKVTPPPDLR